MSKSEQECMQVYEEPKVSGFNLSQQVVRYDSTTKFHRKRGRCDRWQLHKRTMYYSVQRGATMGPYKLPIIAIKRIIITPH